jgi:hypothetical protein
MRALVVLLITGLMLVPAAALAAPGSSNCASVSGTFIGQAYPSETVFGFDVFLVDATGPGAGHPAETQLAWTTIQKITPGGTVHTTGIHIFLDTERFGPMTTHDKGLIAPNGRFHNTLTVVEGGSGMITVHGTVDYGTGLVDSTYRGHVCGS